jgi:hypothetical protein
VAVVRSGITASISSLLACTPTLCSNDAVRAAMLSTSARGVLHHDDEDDAAEMADEEAAAELGRGDEGPAGDKAS